LPGPPLAPTSPLAQPRFAVRCSLMPDGRTAGYTVRRRSAARPTDARWPDQRTSRSTPVLGCARLRSPRGLEPLAPRRRERRVEQGARYSQRNRKGVITGAQTRAAVPSGAIAI
jgi:hypothetical protein